MVPSRSRKTTPSVATRSPGAQPAGVERELGHRRAQLRHRLLDVVLAAVVAVEEHVAAASSAGHLAADRAGLARLLVHLVDRGGRDLRRQLFLLFPRRAEQLREVAQPAAQEGVLHLRRELLLMTKSRERVLVVLLEARRLVADDVVGQARG